MLGSNFGHWLAVFFDPFDNLLFDFLADGKGSLGHSICPFSPIIPGSLRVLILGYLPIVLLGARFDIETARLLCMTDSFTLVINRHREFKNNQSSAPDAPLA